MKQGVLLRCFVNFIKFRYFENLSFDRVINIGDLISFGKFRIASLAINRISSFSITLLMVGRFKKVVV